MIGRAFAWSSLLIALTVPAMAQQITVLDEAELTRQLEISRHTGTPVLAGRISDVPVVQAPTLESLPTGAATQTGAGPLQPVYVGPGVTPPGYRDASGRSAVRLTERTSTINFDFPRGGTRYAGPLP